MEEMTNQQEQLQEQTPQNENKETAAEQPVNDQEQKDIDFYPEMLEDLSEEERSNFFEEHGKGVMNRYFDRALTVDEENSMKNDLYELNLDLMAKTEEKAAVSKRLGDEIKSLQTQMNEVTNNISKGTKEVYEPCVKVLDLKSHRVFYFAQNDGHCVFQRGITGEDLEQSFPFETVYNVIDGDGQKVELVVSRHGGFPEEGDDTSNEDGIYTMDEQSVITVENRKVSKVDRSASTKYEPQVGDTFHEDGDHELPSGYFIRVEDGEVSVVCAPGEERPKPGDEESTEATDAATESAGEAPAE